MKILFIFLAFITTSCLAKNITLSGYKLIIPDDYAIVKNPFHKAAIFIINENDKLALSITKVDKKTFFPLKDYGIDTHRNLFYEIFGKHLTKNRAVLEFRKINSNFKLQEFEILERDNFVFFRTNNSMDNLGHTVFLISTPINDEVIKMDFTNEMNKKLIKSIIDSLEIE